MTSTSLGVLRVIQSVGEPKYLPTGTSVRLVLECGHIKTVDGSPGMVAKRANGLAVCLTCTFVGVGGWPS
jgi:hypothetical protein